MKKSGFVAVIGRPNVGKSTFVNHICGAKVAIVTHIPQTTRNTIKGIFTEGETQMIFLDTPGIHQSAKLYNQILNKQATQALGEADVVLYMLDVSRPIGREERVILDLLGEKKKRVVVAVNKVDVKSKTSVANSLHYNEVLAEYGFNDIFYISALKGLHTEEVIEELQKHIPEGEFFYPEDMLTDRKMDFMVAENIRERVMLETREELPHSINVEVMSLDEDEKIVRIIAQISVERESQKGIVIGKGGAKLKEIGTIVRKDLEKDFHKKVYLELQVKVDKKWRNR